MSSANISFSVPWIPSLKGHVLFPYEDYEDLVRSKAYPNPEEHKDWCYASILPLTQGVPEAADAISECVCALWRLGQLTGVDVGPEWVFYAAAWLVSR